MAFAIISILIGAAIALVAVGGFLFAPEASLHGKLSVLTAGLLPLAAGILILAFRSQLWPVIVAWLLFMVPIVAPLFFRRDDIIYSADSIWIERALQVLAGLVTVLFVLILANKGKSNIPEKHSKGSP
jgi:hypothetical protein